MKTGKVLLLCVLAILLTPCPQVAAEDWAGVYVPKGCVPRVFSAGAEDYSSWIKPYAKPVARHRRSQKQVVQLSLTVLDGDNLTQDPSSGSFLCGTHCCQTSTTYFVSSSGIASMTRDTPMAIQGGGPERLPIQESRTIHKLILDLLRDPPDDHARLPPLGRRLVLHVESGNETVARVYDRADIPSPIMEMLGLIGATDGPIWMNFKPRVRTMSELNEPPIPVSATGIRVLHHRDPVTNGLPAPTATLAISPDSSTIVTRYFNVNARTVVTDRHGAKTFFAISDYELDRREIHISHAFFSPDSRYLLLLSNLPAIYIYDTNTWESVNALPGLPTGLTAFYPSSDWKHGVAVLAKGEVEAWDVSTGQKTSDLDLQGNLQEVSFSEDDSRFAVSSVRLNQDSSSTFHLRVWDTNTGHFIREMVPPYFFQHDVISRPVWWGHGKYLLANVRAGDWGEYMIAVWNVQSGQLRAGFSACDSSQDPFEVGIDGPRLLKWCFDDSLLVWDIPAAMEKITELEESLKKD